MPRSLYPRRTVQIPSLLRKVNRFSCNCVPRGSCLQSPYRRENWIILTRSCSKIFSGWFRSRFYTESSKEACLNLIISITARFRLPRGLISLLLFLAVLGQGCRSLPPADITAPGWSVRQGQAVWHRPDGGEIAGELLVAQGPAARWVVQFIKTPFPLMLGQLTAQAWEVTIPTEKRHFSGPGNPPTKILLLHLPRALSGLPLARDLKWENDSSAHWKLSNLKSGEYLEGYLGE